jgi:hypothetical protein
MLPLSYKVGEDALKSLHRFLRDFDCRHRPPLIRSLRLRSPLATNRKACLGRRVWQADQIPFLQSRRIIWSRPWGRTRGPHHLMPITKPVLRRTRIREVVPEVLPRDFAEDRLELGEEPEADLEELEPEARPSAFNLEVEGDAAAETDRLEAARKEAESEAARAQEWAEAARAEAAREEARAAAGREEVTRLEAARETARAKEATREEAARLEAARETARAKEATREEAAREKAARGETARELRAQLEQARAEATRLEAALLEAARAEGARAEAAGDAEPPQELVRAGPTDRGTAAAEAAAAPPLVAETRTEQPRESLAEPESGTSVLEEHAATAESREPEPSLAQPTERACDIRFWRGYRKAAFYARTFEDGEEVAVAESPLFRVRGNGQPERTREAENAYEALREGLEREGWRLVESGDAWFDHTFRREPRVSPEPASE